MMLQPHFFALTQKRIIFVSFGALPLFVFSASRVLSVSGWVSPRLFDAPGGASSPGGPHNGTYPFRTAEMHGRRRRLLFVALNVHCSVGWAENGEHFQICIFFLLAESDHFFAFLIPGNVEMANVRCSDSRSYFDRFRFGSAGDKKTSRLGKSAVCRSPASSIFENGCRQLKLR